jgi:PIN domain nuclease of toxin-antitoxin system
VVEEALLHRWTRDPFDRLIVAQAAIESVRLLTKDRTIRRNFAGAIWT